MELPSRAWYINSTDRTDIADFYFLTVLPWMKIHNRDIETYQREGYRSMIGLSQDSKLDVNWMSREYSVMADGIAIAGNNATFCPIDGNRIAFYSREARDLQEALPQGWDPDKIAGWALFTDHREQFAVAVKAGKINVAAPAGRPIIVYRDATKVAHRPGA